ncbi:unnamed protein product [Enterobius vermicularis]|uniref:DUF1758 domain-containing protein n=1 Tax=Enterobius vermicularis TaxID=51028 RepID=A0A0N4UT17_ENTVE|nr:unnamed protein product [Enterobius vermicularis]
MRESRSGLSAEITSNGRVKMESCLGYSAERNFVKRSQLKCKDVPSHHGHRKRFFPDTLSAEGSSGKFPPRAMRSAATPETFDSSNGILPTSYEILTNYRSRQDYRCAKKTLRRSAVLDCLKKTNLPDDCELVVLDVGPTGKQMIVQDFEKFREKVGSCQLFSGYESDYYKQLAVVVPKELKNKLLKLADEMTEPLLESTQRNTFEIDVPNTNYKIHFGSGFTPLEVLFPGDFCSLSIGNLPVSWESQTEFPESFDSKLVSLGATNIVRYSPTLKKLFDASGLIRFGSKEAASAALNKLKTDGSQHDFFYEVNFVKMT